MQILTFSVQVELGPVSPPEPPYWLVRPSITNKETLEGLDGTSNFKSKICIELLLTESPYFSWLVLPDHYLTVSLNTLVLIIFLENDHLQIKDCQLT